MRYYIADCHFFHGKLNTKMDNRGFKDTQAMNEYMIAQWNGRVRKNDEVVILGDFSWGKAQDTNELLGRLKGRLYLVEGNHDHTFLKRTGFNVGRFKWVKPYAELHDEKRKVVLCHYPIPCYNGQYRKDGQGNDKTFMLYGHVHNTHDEKLIHNFQETIRNTRRPDREGKLQHIPCHMINCFCMFSDYVPLTLDEWIENDRKRREACEQTPPANP